MWLVLEDGEFITSMDVRAMCWIDGVQFYTNERSSPWYGGHGGEMHRLDTKPAYKIYGFFGSIGSRFTGSLGAMSCLVRHPRSDP